MNTLKNLFNHLEDIFDDFYQGLKIGTILFNNFYLEIICLALNLEYISEILIQKFKYKLIPYFSK